MLFGPDMPDVDDERRDAMESVYYAGQLASELASKTDFPFRRRWSEVEAKYFQLGRTGVYMQDVLNELPVSKIVQLVNELHELLRTVAAERGFVMVEMFRGMHAPSYYFRRQRRR